MVARHAAARQRLQVSEPFAAIDVEVASRRSARICAIGASLLDGGREIRSFFSLVRVDGAIRYTRIHRLTADELAGAPTWPIVWTALMAFLGNVRLIVAFRAAFDRGAILAMCAAYGLEAPHFTFFCVAERSDRLLGGPLSLAATLANAGIPFPGRPHDALADARAASAIALALK
jgi:DNA polymerase-3 subunit epsilon